MLNHKSLAALAIVSAPLGATELDSLITSSQSIRDSFTYGVQAIGGMANYANQGGIANSGITDPGLISKAQQDAYNNATLAFQQAVYTWNPNADDYFLNQSQQSLTDMSQAIDAFVAAATAVVEVTTVNEMAQEAAQAPDARESIALQEYIAANDVILEDAEVASYNESLQAVEVAAQTAAAYMAVANDPTLLQSANDSAMSLNVTYQESTNAFFDAATGTLTVEWAEQNAVVALDLNSYYKADVDILTEGANSMFYHSSPVGPCWYISDPAEREACVYGS